jgi:hypothetical protein
MDFLPQWMQILAQQNIIQRPFENCQQCLLYADDTLFILKPDIQQIRVLKLILDIYGQLSGMRMNLQKSELLITCTDISLVQQLAEEIGCKATDFPFQYLGMPLSNKKLKKRALPTTYKQSQKQIARLEIFIVISRRKNDLNELNTIISTNILHVHFPTTGMDNKGTR